MTSSLTHNMLQPADDEQTAPCRLPLCGVEATCCHIRTEARLWLASRGCELYHAFSNKLRRAHADWWIRMKAQCSKYGRCARWTEYLAVSKLVLQKV
jgi:hypothetical protein